jgi:hypothetical protein
VRSGGKKTFQEFPADVHAGSIQGAGLAEHPEGLLPDRTHQHALSTWNSGVRTCGLSGLIICPLLGRAERRNGQSVSSFAGRSCQLAGARIRRYARIFQQPGRLPVAQAAERDRTARDRNRWRRAAPPGCSLVLEAGGCGVFACDDRLVVPAGLPEGDSDVAGALPCPALAWSVAAQPAGTGCRLMCRDGLIRLPQILHDQAEVALKPRLRLAGARAAICAGAAWQVGRSSGAAGGSSARGT